MGGARWTQVLGGGGLAGWFPSPDPAPALGAAPRLLGAHGAAPLPLCQVGIRPGAPGLSMPTPRASVPLPGPAAAGSSSLGPRAAGQYRMRAPAHP